MEKYDRSYIIHQYVKNLGETKTTCSNCNRVFYGQIKPRWYPKPETSTECNDCWIKAKQQIVIELWKKVYQYKPQDCVVCHKKKEDNPHKDYFYCNTNVFDPLRPRISEMINKEEDWIIIQKSLDECQGICTECEVVINDILPQLNYDATKNIIDKQLLEGTITPENYNRQMDFYRVDYEIKMKELIDGLSKLFVEQ